MGDVVRAHLQVEAYFFRHAIGMTLGALPFALISIGPTGVAIAAVWGVIYLGLTFPGWIIILLALGDLLLIANGRRPVLYPSVARAETIDREAIMARLRPFHRLWMDLTLRFGFYLHPLTIPTMYLAGYIRDQAARSNGDPKGGPSSTAYVAKVHRREQQIEDIEAMVGVA